MAKNNQTLKNAIDMLVGAMSSAGTASEAAAYSQAALNIASLMKLTADSAPEQAFITVPIVDDFCQDKVIGELRIRADAMPDHADFAFAIGVRLEDSAKGYRLVCVSPVPYTHLKHKALATP